jgi:hypothetical protein
MTDRCPHCHQPMPQPKPKGRQCFDCKGPIGRHDKWTWAERNDVLTCVHRHCDNPESYHPKGANPIAPAPLFDAEAA